MYSAAIVLHDHSIGFKNPFSVGLKGDTFLSGLLSLYTWFSVVPSFVVLLYIKTGTVASVLEFMSVDWMSVPTIPMSVKSPHMISLLSA